MPSKQLLPLNRFDGGLNTSTNPRDLNDTEYVTGDNIDSSVAGRLRFLGKWDDYADVSGLNELNDIYIKKGGYGIFYFPVDNDVNDGSEIDGRYLAVFEPRFDSIQTVDTVSTPTAADGGYNDVDYTTDGNGLDAVFDIQVTNPDGKLATIAVVDGGKDFAVDDTITATDLGGGGTSVTFDVATIAASPKVNLYIEPTSNGINSCTAPIDLSSSPVSRLYNGVQGSGAADENTRIDYLYIDGALRVFDHDHKFDPQKWWFLDDGYTYFKLKDTVDTSEDEVDPADRLSFTSDSITGYKQSKQFVEAPTGGIIIDNDSDNVPEANNTGGSNDGTLSTNGTEVGLIINSDEQTNDTDVGWGKTESVGIDYDFYASFVYDGNQES